MARKAKPKAKEIVITGVVTANDWDEDDQVVGLTLVTEDDEEYLIERNPIHDELLDFVRREVELTGTMTEDEEGNQVIEPISFDVLGDGDEDDDYEENEDDEFEHDRLEEEEDEDEDDDYR